MSREKLLKILDLARWAPSGDNTQPWRFEILADDRIAVHGFDTRDRVLYDFEGHASHLAHGALLETMRIAASHFGLSMSWTMETDEEARTPIYQTTFSDIGDMEPSPLFPFIKKRTVQRRRMRTSPLSEPQRKAIVGAVASDCTLQFFETAAERLKVAKLLWRNAHIRLTCPEAFPVHQEVIEWCARFSKDRIPEQAVGVDPLTASLMRWVMQSWKRVEFFNRYLFATIPPRLQLDVLPALYCAAHILVRPTHTPKCPRDWVVLGMAMQRLWLTATQQGLHLQPEMTPIIFRWYVQAERSISVVPSINRGTRSLARRLEYLSCSDRNTAFSFFCRVGQSLTPRSRSLRLSLKALVIREPTDLPSRP